MKKKNRKEGNGWGKKQKSGKLKNRLLAILMIASIFAGILGNPVLMYGNPVDVKMSVTGNRMESGRLAQKNLLENATEEIRVKSKSMVLMEASTGKIIASSGEEEELMLASVTKIMTLLLIYEAMEERKFDKDDIVTVSAHAAGMGGSQVYLEEGEQQKVEDLIKCIAIASANDAATAMAEYVAGSEEAFVKKMNDKATELGMEHTRFSNCCGLDGSLSKKDHYSCALDIAIMSRELINRFPQVTEYTTTWMDTITHVTRKGESEFGLTNTNKLVRYYDGITGIKTGFTGKAGFCLSASATRDGLSLIAVVMGAASSKDRFEDATRLLDYGFANLCIYKDPCSRDGYPIEVKQGKVKELTARPEKDSAILLPAGQSKQIEKKVVLKENVKAPLKKGDAVGEVQYLKDGTCIEKISIVIEKDVEKADFSYYFDRVCRSFFFIFQNPT